ncbi:MAG: GIY-YIG nuclease family protein, partial [Candidatus Saganbacteria bacterium]|nr:GIY-YIG nuclease family protein [Candidatus Saganbacteria bacterium]
MEDKGYLYILKSEKDGRFYIGQTSDLIERMAAHTRGSVKSTKNRRPLELVFFKSFNSKSEAMREENRLKCYKKTKDFL